MQLARTPRTLQHKAATVIGAPCVVPPIQRRLAAAAQPSSARQGPDWASGLLGMAASVLLSTQVQPALAQENPAARAVSQYVELESQGKFKNVKGLDDFRQKHQMKRGADGRLQLRNSRGEWFQVRLDMEVPGSMLLRDSKGYVYAIQTETIQQIDLSDDLVALMMFADGEWERQMSPVEYMDDKGATKHLQLEESEFREVVGLLKEVQDLEEEQALSK